MAATLGTCDIGDQPVVTATFKNTAGTATDPSTVVFLLRTPAGVTAEIIDLAAATVTVERDGKSISSRPMTADELAMYSPPPTS